MCRPQCVERNSPGPARKTGATGGLEKCLSNVGSPCLKAAWGASPSRRRLQTAIKGLQSEFVAGAGAGAGARCRLEPFLPIRHQHPPTRPWRRSGRSRTSPPPRSSTVRTRSRKRSSAILDRQVAELRRRHHRQRVHRIPRRRAQRRHAAAARPRDQLGQARSRLRDRRGGVRQPGPSTRRRGGRAPGPILKLPQPLRS